MSAPREGRRAGRIALALFACALCLLVLEGCAGTATPSTTQGGTGAPSSTTAAVGGHGTATQASSADFDVVVYGSSTSGIGVVRGLQLASAQYGGPLRVALVSAGAELESPLVQGLCVEDVFAGSSASGFYAEFRQGIRRYYQPGSYSPPAGLQRLTYEPAAAASVLNSFLDRKGVRYPKLTRYQGRLISASDAGGKPEVEVLTSSGIVRLHAKYLVDASPEGDLGRLVGASYMVGSSEVAYNDQTAPAPPPSAANDWATAPQSLSLLLTLKVYPGTAPPVGQMQVSGYDPGSYGSEARLSTWALQSFADSWTLTNVLPGDQRELNQAWADYTNALTSFRWTMHPEERADILGTLKNWTLNRVRFLQENGYPNVGVSVVPTIPYVREGVRFLGKEVYTSGDVAKGRSLHSIASGRYATFDRHDPLKGSTQVDRAATVHVPMGALEPVGHPWLLVTTAISCESRAYSSAVRTEPVRANVGEAAGVMLAVAAALDEPAADVSYPEVRAELDRLGVLVD